MPKRGDARAKMYVAVTSKKLADVGERSEKLKEVTNCLKILFEHPR